MTREEAIQIVKTTKDWGELRLALQELIPELRESEDERARKELILYFNSQDIAHQYVTEEKRERWVSYLEKQKEQKLNNIELIQQSWYMEGYQDRGHNREPKWIVKTGEGGPRYEENPKYGQDLVKLRANPYTFSEPYSPDEYEAVEIGNATCLRRKEQKPAEKQDYSGLNDSERAIHRGFLAAGVENVPVGIIKETTKDCIAHFPWPTEWSKEDEKVYSRLLNHYENLTHCITTADRHQEIREELNFLKSLRPSWKPTMEQIKGLKFFLDFHRLQRNAGTTNWKEFDAVESLYNDIRKL